MSEKQQLFLGNFYSWPSDLQILDYLSNQENSHLEEEGRWLIRSDVSSENSSSVSELRLLLSVNADFFPIITSPGNHRLVWIVKVNHANLQRFMMLSVPGSSLWLTLGNPGRCGISSMSSSAVSKTTSFTWTTDVQRYTNCFAPPYSQGILGKLSFTF